MRTVWMIENRSIETYLHKVPAKLIKLENESGIRFLDDPDFSEWNDHILSGEI